MDTFLAGAFFKFFLVPVLSVCLGVYIKYVTRNDQYARFSKEDVAVGFDLMRAAFLTYLILLSDKARSLIEVSRSLGAVMTSARPNVSEIQRLQAVSTGLSQDLLRGVFSVAVLLFGMWATSTLVRKKGWKSSTELDTWFGLTVPLAGGFAYLAVVWAGS
jgi:hypothetical protein